MMVRAYACNPLLLPRLRTSDSKVASASCYWYYFLECRAESDSPVKDDESATDSLLAASKVQKEPHHIRAVINAVAFMMLRDCDVSGLRLLPSQSHCVHIDTNWSRNDQVSSSCTVVSCIRCRLWRY